MMELRLLKMLATTLSASVLLGCATAEYTETYRQCDRVSYSHFPQVYENRVITKSRLVQVPTGQTTCESRNVPDGGTVGNPRYRVITECKERMRSERQYYNETIRVDVNYDARRNFVSSCVVNACMNKYGNRSCER